MALGSPCSSVHGRRRPTAPGRRHALGPVRGGPRSTRDAGSAVGAVARLRNATATSAGGVVIRYLDGIPQLVVGSRRREPDGLTWTLPKGTPHSGETTEQTAVREVAEETGLEVRITGPLDSIEYWFVQRGTRIHKTVHYFLMEPIGGDLARHDHEFEHVRWLSMSDAPGLLTFETERALVAHAADRIGFDLGGRVAHDGASSGDQPEPVAAGASSGSGNGARAAASGS